MINYKAHDVAIFLFAFTSVFAFYSKLYLINNLFVIILILISALMFNRPIKSRLFLAILLIVILNYISYFFIVNSEGVNLTPSSLTFLFIFLLCFSADRASDNVTFEKLITLNVLLLPVLFLLGGVNTYQGRIHTDWLTPNLIGMLVFFGYMVTGRKLLKGENKVFNGVLLLACATFIILSGSRQNSLFLLFGSLFLILPIIKSKNYHGGLSFYKKTFILILFFLFTSIILYKSIDTLKTRFNSNHATSVMSVGNDHSSQERYNYIKSAVDSVIGYPFGVGHANIEFAIKKYGSNQFKVTSNAHSLFAELLISIGVFGCVFWLWFIIYFTKICFTKENFYTYGYMPIYLLVASFTSPLLSLKIFWVVLVILDKQLNKTNNAR